MEHLSKTSQEPVPVGTFWSGNRQTFCGHHQRAQNLLCYRSDEVMYLSEAHPLMLFVGSQEVELLFGQVSQHFVQIPAHQRMWNILFFPLWNMFLFSEKQQLFGDEMSWTVSAEGRPHVNACPTSDQTKAEKITTHNLSPSCCLYLTESNLSRIGWQNGSNYETLSALTL